MTEALIENLAEKGMEENMAVEYSEKKTCFMVYTREVSQADYPDGLARSIHFAWSRDGVHYQAMNSNYGILFAKGTIRPDHTICPKGVKNPKLYALSDGSFCITAERVNEDGSADLEAEGKVLCWKTQDFIRFEEKGLQEEAELCRELVCRETVCKTEGKEELRKGVIPQGAIPGRILAVDRSLADRAVLAWSKLHSVAVQVPERVCAQQPSDLEKITATVVYSDGSTAQKKVDWNLEAADWGKSGKQRIQGTVRNEQYRFPLACGYGDPVILPWEGKYYYISTNDNLDDVGFYMREADDVDGLFADGVIEHLILPYDEERGFVQTFWAPEFHVIGGELYILFAISGKVWGPQCHLMKLKKGASLIAPDSWEEPIRIQRKDGGFLAEDGITLDMTYLQSGDQSYVAWSYREHIGTPLDTGSMLYIAAIEENEPWKLTSEPVLLTRPLYGWENVSGTINNEGPYAFRANGKIYLTYSGGAANGYTYVLGLLTAEDGADLLELASWNKRGTPVLSFYSIDGIYGPGHNAFFVDHEGNLMMSYHAETEITSDLRCNAIHRIHFDIHGEPVFDLSAERDLDPKLAAVEMEVEIL